MAYALVNNYSFRARMNGSKRVKVELAKWRPSHWTRLMCRLMCEWSGAFYRLLYAQ